jgi:type I restriction enzyme S subunit
VPQDPNDEPASELLKRIAAEKAELVKQGKIKKQKPLPEISEDEKPFELPEGWEWVRLGHMFKANRWSHNPPKDNGWVTYAE